MRAFSCLFHSARGVNVCLKHIGFGSKKGKRTSLFVLFEFLLDYLAFAVYA